MAETNKAEALKRALDKVNKDMGAGTVMKFTDKPIDLECITSGSIKLDRILGKGYVRGRIYEFLGMEMSGKTTLALHAIAEFQKKGETCLLIDAENSISLDYCKSLGIDIDNLLISQESGAENALQMVETFASSGAVGLIILDSVAGLCPISEQNSEIGDSKVGVMARLMSQTLRKITSIANQNKCTIIFINQWRLKIGVLFGNPEVSTGGLALQYYSSTRLDIKRSTINKDGETAVGNIVKVKTIKNKVAPPFQTAELEVVYGEGFSKYGEIVDLGVEFELIKKSGSWFSLSDGTKLGQGKDNVKQLLQDNPELCDKLELEIREKMGL